MPPIRFLGEVQGPHGVFTFIFMFTCIFSGGIIPDYMNVNNFGLLDTIMVARVAAVIQRLQPADHENLDSSEQYPGSLEESARIDGAGHFRILLTIVLPLSKPIIATLPFSTRSAAGMLYQDALFYIKHEHRCARLQLKLYYLVIQASESFQLEADQVQLSNPEVLKASVRCLRDLADPLCISVHSEVLRSRRYARSR